MLPEYIAAYDEDGKFYVIHEGIIVRKDKYSAEWRKFLAWNYKQKSGIRLCTDDVNPASLKEEASSLSLLGLYRLILENRITLNTMLERLGLSLRLNVPTLDDQSKEAEKEDPTGKV